MSFRFTLLYRREVRNTEEYKAVMRSEWDGEKFNLGQDIDKVEQVVKVSAGQAYYLVSGAFDFDEIKEFLEEAGHLPLPYWHERDIYAWQDVRDENIRSVILFPDSNSYYFDEGFPFVERVLKALDEGEGFIGQVGRHHKAAGLDRLKCFHLRRYELLPPRNSRGGAAERMLGNCVVGHAR